MLDEKKSMATNLSLASTEEFKLWIATEGSFLVKDAPMFYCLTIVIFTAWEALEGCSPPMNVQIKEDSFG